MKNFFPALLLAGLLAGGGCDAEMGAAAPTSDVAIDNDDISTSSCGKSDYSGENCTTTSSDTTTTHDPCEYVRKVEGEWYRNDTPKKIHITCQVESDMTCSLTVAGDGATFEGTFRDVINIPIEYIPPDGGSDTLQVDYDNVNLYQRSFSPSGELYGEAKFHREH